MLRGTEQRRSIVDLHGLILKMDNFSCVPWEEGEALGIPCAAFGLILFEMFCIQNDPASNPPPGFLTSLLLVSTDPFQKPFALSVPFSVPAELSLGDIGTNPPGPVTGCAQPRGRAQPPGRGQRLHGARGEPGNE